MVTHKITTTKIIKSKASFKAVNDMTKEQFIEITEWQDATFPNATALSKVHHLKEEVEELIFDLENNRMGKTLEFADCFLLLFGAAAKDGMTYEDCCNSIAEKFSICKNRVWSKPDTNGVVKHVKKSIWGVPLNTIPDFTKNAGQRDQ